MYFSVLLNKLFIITYLSFVFGLGAFAEPNEQTNGKEQNNLTQEVKEEKPLLTDTEIKHLLSRSFSKDFSKYHFTTRMKVEHSCRVVIPLGLGVGLFFVSGPGAAIPVVVGIGYGIKARVDYVQNKKTRSLMKGSLLFLQGMDIKEMPSRNRYRLKVFEKFFRKVRNDLQTYIGKDVSEQELKSYLAYQLLIINRYGALVVERYKHIKKPKWWKGPLTETFSVSFLRRNLIPLINDCSNYLVETMNCSDLDEMVGR